MRFRTSKTLCRVFWWSESERAVNRFGCALLTSGQKEVIFAACGVGSFGGYAKRGVSVCYMRSGCVFGGAEVLLCCSVGGIKERIPSWPTESLLYTLGAGPGDGVQLDAFECVNSFRLALTV